MEKFIKSFILSALFIALAGTGTVWAEEVMPDLSMENAPADELSMDAEPKMAGRVESTGIYFEVKDSEWLNVSVVSSELIKLTLESVPNMITMHIAAAAGAATTQITIKGLAPQTTYHKYEDNYHNHEAFTTDDNGSYTYTQDLSAPHIVFIQTKKSTKFIKDDATGGDCYSIGIWDSATKTCTMTMDLNETIQIDSDGVTLDGNGHTITGSGTGNGVYLYGRTGVIVKNLNVNKFNDGMALYYSSSNNIIGNTIEDNSFGINLNFANNNNITGNTASYNGYGIISEYLSNNNIITGNIINSNSNDGIYIVDWANNSHDNSIIGNIINSNIGNGFRIYRSHKTIFTGNTVNSNGGGGMLFRESGNNVISDNTVSGNTSGITVTGKDNVIMGNIISSSTGGSVKHYGIGLGYNGNNTVTGNTVYDNYLGLYLPSAGNQKIYNNNFINNTRQTYVLVCSNCLFNLQAPIGGNYWSGWTTPDNNGDGFVDMPYVINAFRYIQDNLPWTKQDGWKPSDSIAPTTTASLSGTSGNNGWYLSDVQVALTATDNEGGSGVARTEYSFDGANWVTYTAPFMVTAEGTTTVYYKSADSAGNVETAKSLSVSIDKTLPTIAGTATTSPNANGWYSTDVTVHFTASDNISGINSVAPDTIISSEGANQSVTGTAFDMAGNFASATVSGINVDKTAPVITITSPAAIQYDHSTTLNISFTADDNVSGVYKTAVYLNGQQYEPANPISLINLSLGIHTLKVESENYAGLAASQSVDFEIIATASGTTSLVTTLYQAGAIDSAGIVTSLTQMLEAGQLEAFINMLEAQSGKHISSSAAEILMADALYMLGQ